MKKISSLIIIAVIAYAGNAFAITNKMNQKILPTRITIPLHDESEMELGDSRVIEVMFFSGNDNLEDDNFQNVTERGIEWITEPEGIVSIDKYGRVETLQEGDVNIKVKSTANPKVFDTKKISVVKNATVNSVPQKQRVDYNGKPAKPLDSLQKFVKKYDLADADVPKKVKDTVLNPVENSEVKQDDVIWEIVNFADGSDGKYITRTDLSKQDTDRDKIQYFIGNRYLPGNGKSPEMILDDGNNGLWVLGDLNETPQISHIEMREINYADKAALMSSITDKYVSRMGLMSEAKWNGNEWISKLDDNDGLWTSMFDAGELMRYAVLKDEGAPSKEISKARASAIKSLKSVLFIANISGRDGVVDARIRHLENTREGDANYAVDEYLKEDAYFALDNYAGSPADSIGAYNDKFSLGVINPEDWTTTEEPATTKRNLKGFVARSFYLPEIEGDPGGGIYFRRNVDDEGGQKVVKEVFRLYDYEEDELPVIKTGNIPIPEILEDVLIFDGKQYRVEDVAYKGDTSTDEIAGHLFLYKVAFDILDDNDPEEKALKELVVETVVNLADHYRNNGYGLCDVTGQATSWGNTTRNYLSSDFTIEDRALGGLVALTTFKLSYYMTDEKKWEEEYLILAESESFRFADLGKRYWEQWMWLIEENLTPDEIEQLTDEERTRLAAYSLNYSDEEMVMLLYYVLFQIEDNEELLEAYKEGLNNWWISMSRSENPLWYYIYQLTYPNESKTDAFGNDLIDTASWALSRIPVDTRRMQAYIDGSRPDVLVDRKVSIDPNKVIAERVANIDVDGADTVLNQKVFPDYKPENIYQIKVLPQDERFMHKYNQSSFKENSSSNPNTMEASTVYTLPYWFGRYHNMLK